MTDKSNIRICFATAANVHSPAAWSGTMLNMYRALCQEFESVETLGPLSSPLRSKAERLLDKIARVVFRGGYNYLHRHHRSHFMARQLQQKLDETDCDVIFAPAASTEIAHLKTGKPICYLSDTSFDQITGYYKKYSKYSASAMKEGGEIEKLSIEKAAALIYPSKWAASFVVDHYGAESERVHVLPFGANMADKPERESVLPKTVNTTWQILFLGVCWERKGGAIALRAFEELLARGFDAKLIVCGCVPPVTHPGMEVIPYLNKKDPDDYEKFKNLLESSHLLLLPTRAEAFGVVFCEASAYGMPSITTATGGTSGAVKDGVNGYTLPYHAEAGQYADIIGELFADPEKYHQLSRSSRQQYEDALNWGAWAKSMREILVGLKAS